MFLNAGSVLGEQRMTLLEAARDFQIGSYIYQWDNFYQRYRAPIFIGDSPVIAPYETFYVDVLNKDGLNIVFLDPDESDNEPPVFPGLMRGSHDETYYFYEFTLPVPNPYNDVNLFYEMERWSSGILLESDYDTFDWGVSKYIFYKSDFYYPEEKYFDDTIGEKLYPGQSYALYHTFNPFSFEAPADVIEPSGEISRRLPFAPEPYDEYYTMHHIGNPYWVDLDLSTYTRIEIPYDSSLPLGKIAESIDIGDIETWYVKLSLQVGDEIVDEYNRAGIATNYSDDTRIIKALDMVSPNDPVRLSIYDPSSEDQTRFAYDIRPSGESEYIWEIEIETTSESVNATLNIDNIIAVPEGFRIALEDNASGETYDITEDRSIEVSLTSSTMRTFSLIAVDMPTEVADEGKPEAFGIRSASPNPFNPSTTITYTLDAAQNVSLDIFNINGQLITNLVNQPVSAGIHTVVWNASGNAAGVYVVRMSANNSVDTQKIMLIK